MKPTNRQVLELNHSLQLLESRIGTDGKVCPTGYVLGKASYAIAKNLRKIGVITSDLEGVRQKLLAPLIAAKSRRLGCDVNVIVPSDTEHTEFMNVWLALLSEESDFEPNMITVDDLNLDKNSIPPSLINALEIILKE